MKLKVRMLCRRRVLSICLAASGLLQAGCSTLEAMPNSDMRVTAPLKQGWFENKMVFYLTTDASDAGVAKDLQANFSPRLSHALASNELDKNSRKSPSSVDKVYAFLNFPHANVFASAPKPVGYQSTESAYTPLWQMMTVTWANGITQGALTSEEAILDSAEKGLVTVASTGVIVNCPIVYRGADDALPGISVPKGLGLTHLGDTNAVR